MTDPIRNQLGAYLDGELDPRGQSEVRAHLETCQACQAELAELRRLSQRLHAAPQPDFTPALDFKAQLMMQLPRRAEPARPRSNGQALAWAAPALVLAGWIFIQVALGLTTLVSLADQAGFLDGAAGWAASSPQQMSWFTALQVTAGGTLGPVGLSALQFLNDTGVFTQALVEPLLWQAGAALLYWGAMTLLWHNKVKALWTSIS